MAKKMFGSLFVISAPSGAGKTSLVQELIKKDSDIVVSVSTTTRKPRSNEVHGINYFFEDRSLFEQKIKQNDFLEYATVFGNYYGTSKSSVKRLLSTGKDVILEIDWQGAKLVRKIMPKVTTIFILPPSLQELKKRLNNRATDTEETILKRLDESINEISHYREFDYLVINDVFNAALNDLHSIFRAERLSTKQQQIKHNALISALI